MKSFQFKTCFGTVVGHLAEDVCEFESNECIVIGMDSDNDGPYWENNDYNWGDLNDLCHRIADENIYRVADQADKTIIDSTDSYEEMDTWKAWVTTNAAKLHETVKKSLLQDLQHMVNKEMLSLNDESLGMPDVVQWSKEVYDYMLENYV